MPQVSCYQHYCGLSQYFAHMSDYSSNSQLVIQMDLHTCLSLRLNRICSGKSWNSTARSGNTDSLSKVLDSVILEKQQTLPFRFFLRVAELFVLELTEVTFGCFAHVRKTEPADLLLEVLYAWVKTWNRKVSPKFPWSCKPCRSEAGCHLWKRFVYDGKHGRVFWSRTCKTIPSEKEMFPNI